MQLNQQGRVLDSGGSPINATATLVVQIQDGSGASQFTETFSNVLLADGYYGVILGAGTTTLDTSVFLDHGAMALDIAIDGVSVGGGQLGGYPVVVAQQSLLAKEASVQQLIAGTGLYSETCTDFAARGWASLFDCQHDGRWHKVYDRTTGAGAIADIRTHVDAGASLRVVTTQQPAAWDCVSVSYLDRSWGDGSAGVACHSAQTSHPGPHNQNVSGAYWSTYELWTDGRVYYTERTGSAALFSGAWHSDAKGEWFVRY
jgi:hypothetical protein